MPEILDHADAFVHVTDPTNHDGHGSDAGDMSYLQLKCRVTKQKYSPRTSNGRMPWLQKANGLQSDRNGADFHLDARA